MREHLIAAVEWKAAADGPGELEGYCSVFGNVDQGGDIVLPGAFKKTLADWRRSKQPMPLIADHELSTDGVIGSVRKAAEDGVGLKIHAAFSSDPKAQSVRVKMLEGHLKGMSFAYDTVRHYMGEVAGKPVRYLQELKLFEATVTPFPMNALAVASAKTMPWSDLSMDFGEWADSMAQALAISYEPARKAAAGILIGAWPAPETDAAGIPDGEPTADAAAPEGTAVKAGSYALSLITPSGPRDGAPDPLAALKMAQDAAEADRLEAQITTARKG